MNPSHAGVRIRFAAVAAALASSAAACGGEEPSPPAASASSSSPPGVVTVAKGQIMTASDGEAVTVTNATAVTPNANATLPAGKQCLAVSVSLKDNSQLGWSTPLAQMTVRDSAGQIYNSNNGLGICPVSSSGFVEGVLAGDQSPARMIFLVPSTGHLVFYWTPTHTGEALHQPPVLLGGAYQSPLR